MKRLTVAFLLGVLFLVLQTTLLTALPIQRIRPDILLIFTLYLGFSYPPISGGILAFFMGYLMDLFCGSTLGLYTFSRLVLYYLAHLFRSRFYLEGFPSQFLFVFIFSLMENFFILTFINVFNSDSIGDLASLFFTRLLPQSCFTGLLAPVFFSLLNRGFSLIGGRERRP
jgi:rod shape-determining protein MreD